MQGVSIYLEDDEYYTLKRMATRMGKSLSSYAREKVLQAMYRERDMIAEDNLIVFDFNTLMGIFNLTTDEVAKELKRGRWNITQNDEPDMILAYAIAYGQKIYRPAKHDDIQYYEQLRRERAIPFKMKYHSHPPIRAQQNSSPPKRADCNYKRVTHLLAARPPCRFRGLGPWFCVAGFHRFCRLQQTESIYYLNSFFYFETSMRGIFIFSPPCRSTSCIFCRFRRGRGRFVPSSLR